MALTTENVARNGLKGVVHSRRLLWGDANDLERVQSMLGAGGSGEVDIILGSDITACPYAAALPKLVDTLFALSTPGRTTVLLAHKDRHNSETKFWELARQRFVVRELPRSCILPAEFRQDAGLHLTQLRVKKAL